MHQLAGSGGAEDSGGAAGAEHPGGAGVGGVGLDEVGGAGGELTGVGGTLAGAGGELTGVGGEGGAAPAPPIQGNITVDNLPQQGSVGFVLVGHEYELFKKEGAADTSIAFIAPDGKTAYGWYRNSPVSDPTNVDVAFSLDLTTGTFSDIPFTDSRASIIRGGNGGKLVGKMILMNATPDDRSDDLRRGFIYDVDTQQLELVERAGYGDIGFTAINASGIVTGFNDFGALGFVYENGQFVDLVNDSAYRLFPFAITSDQTIVGAWGGTEDDWFEETKGVGFVAEPTEAGGYDSEPFPFEGYAAGYLTGLNDAGAFCGTGYRTVNSYRTLLRGSSLSAAAESVPFPADYEPFPTGIAPNGLIFGQAMAVEVKKECAGHGTLSGDTCNCDSDYELDPVDSKNCIAVGAPCSGHGHEHGPGECHCDAGFKNPIGDESQCVPS
jgi:hypothetical protein